MGRTFGRLGVGFPVALLLARCTFATDLETLEAAGGESGANGETGGSSAGGSRPTGGSAGVSQGGRAGNPGGTGGRASGGANTTGGVTDGGLGGDGGGGDTGPGGSGTCDEKTTGNCHFEPLGKTTYSRFNRCDGGASRAQSDEYAKLVGASSIEECEAACLESPDCTAVSDYFDEPGLGLCYLMTSPCDAPSINIDSEEDAAKMYKKVCDQSGTCHLEYLGLWVQCESSGGEQVMGATSRKDCDDLCLARADCTAVRDYFWIAEVRGCYLFSGDCCGTASLPYGDPGQAFRKVCD